MNTIPMIVPISHDTTGSPREPIAAAKLVSGAPVQLVANAFSDPGESFHCGVWEGEVGAWRVCYTENEFCHVLSGKIRILSDAGNETVAHAGDSFVIPAGFEGIWEVLEPAKKLYAIYEPS